MSFVIDEQLLVSDIPQCTVVTDWIAPVVGERQKAACKFCSCILRAHYSDLRHHSASAKHRKNAEWYDPETGTAPQKPVQFTSRKCNYLIVKFYFSLVTVYHNLYSVCGGIV